MRIELERSGGFAGMQLSGHVETTDLSEDETRTLEESIRAARFWDLPEEIQGEERGADRFQYALTVETEEERHTVRFRESAMSENLQSLVDVVMRLVRRQR